MAMIFTSKIKKTSRVMNKGNLGNCQQKNWIWGSRPDITQREGRKKKRKGRLEGSWSLY